MYFKKIISAAVLIFLSSVYFSCDTIIDTSSSVSGKVYTYDYLPISNVKVTIRNQAVLTSEDGSFSFKNISFPYDLIVSDTLERHATVYKDLSTENVLLPLRYFTSNNEFAFINVSIPKNIIHTDMSGKIIFTDGNHVNSFTDIYSNDTAARLDMYINKPLTGRLIVLTFKKNSNSEIISYENYGESSDFQILPGENYYRQFDSLDLSFNPGEQNVSGFVQIPPGSYSNYSNFYLSFSSKKAFVYSWFAVTGTTNFNFKIPSGLPRQFNTIVRHTSYFGSAGSSEENFIVYPNAPNNLQVKVSPIIISPDNNVKNVNNNTQFSFNGGTGNGIYIITLFNQSRNVEYKIVTSNTNFTLGNLEDLGFGRINNNYFMWGVRKAGPANSMNDYVTNSFNEPGSFLLESESRSFSTEP